MARSSTRGTSSMTADEESNTTVTATSKVEGKNSTGVGASFALAIAFNQVTAGIDNGETVNGTAGGLYAQVTSSHTINTTATGGAAGDTAVGGGIAITYVENSAHAFIG